MNQSIDAQGALLPGPAGDVLDGDAEKHDVNPLSKVGRGFVCENAGTVKFKTYRGTTVTINAAANVVYPWALIQLFDNGTTATGIWIGAD